MDKMKMDPKPMPPNGSHPGGPDRDRVGSKSKEGVSWPISNHPDKSKMKG